MRTSPSTSRRARALACPASLKGVLAARDAAAALAVGLRTWAAADELPLADGGEGTLDAIAPHVDATWRDAEVRDAFGEPRRARWLAAADGTAYVEAAEAIPLDAARLEPLLASSRGLGELIAATDARRLVVFLGGTATMDAGAGLRAVVESLPAQTVVACDVDVTLYDAPRLFGPQKGASPEDVVELERRFRADSALAPVALVRGSGAAGGLGAAFAALGAELVRGAPFVLDVVGFAPAAYDIVVTGEGTVDETSVRGKVAGEVARRCAEARVPCVVFGGRVVEPVPGTETVALSGDPSRAREDLEAFGANVARFARR